MPDQLGGIRDSLAEAKARLEATLAGEKTAAPPPPPATSEPVVAAARVVSRDPFPWPTESYIATVRKSLIH